MNVLDPGIALKNLEPQEVEILLSVLQRDSQLRKQEEKRLNSIKNDIRAIRRKAALRPDDEGKDAANFCTRCRAQFGLVSNRGELCPKCHSKVCQKCRKPVTAKYKWLCLLCYKQRELAAQSGEWFYSKLRDNDKNVVILGSDLLKASLRKSGVPDIPDWDTVSNGSAKSNGSVAKEDGVSFTKDADSARLIDLVRASASDTSRGSKELGLVTVKRVSSRRMAVSDSSSTSSDEDLPMPSRVVPSREQSVSQQKEDRTITVQSPDSAIVLSNDSDAVDSDSNATPHRRVGQTESLTWPRSTSSDSDSNVEYTVEEQSKIKFKRCSISNRTVELTTCTSPADQPIIEEGTDHDSDATEQEGQIGAPSNTMHTSHLSGTKPIQHNSTHISGGGSRQVAPSDAGGVLPGIVHAPIDPLASSSSMLVMQALDDETLEIHIVPNPILSAQQQHPSVGISKSFENPGFSHHDDMLDVYNDQLYTVQHAPSPATNIVETASSGSDENGGERDVRIASEKELRLFHELKAALETVKTKQSLSEDHPISYGQAKAHADVLDYEVTQTSDVKLHCLPRSNSYHEEDSTEFLDASGQEYYDDVDGVKGMYTTQPTVGYQYANQLFGALESIDDAVSDNLSVIAEVTEPEDDSDSDISLTIENFPDLAQFAELDSMATPLKTDLTSENLFLPVVSRKKRKLWEENNKITEDILSSSCSSTLSEVSDHEKSFIENKPLGQRTERTSHVQKGTARLIEAHKGEIRPKLLISGGRAETIVVTKEPPTPSSAGVYEEHVDVNKMKSFWSDQTRHPYDVTGGRRLIKPRVVSDSSDDDVYIPPPRRKHGREPIEPEDPSAAAVRDQPADNTGGNYACYDVPVSPLEDPMSPFGDDSLELVTSYKRHLEEMEESSPRIDTASKHPADQIIVNQSDPSQLYATVQKKAKKDTDIPTHSMNTTGDTHVTRERYVSHHTSVNVAPVYETIDDSQREPADGQSQPDVELALQDYVMDDDQPYETIEIHSKENKDLPTSEEFSHDSYNPTTNQLIDAFSHSLGPDATYSPTNTLTPIAPPRKKRPAPMPQAGMSERALQPDNTTNTTTRTESVESSSANEDEDEMILPAVTVKPQVEISDDDTNVNNRTLMIIPSLEISHADDDQELIDAELTDDFQNDEHIDELFASQKPIVPRSNLGATYGGSHESIVSYYSDAGEGNYGKIPVSGEIQFGLDYNYKNCILEVNVKQCRNLAPVDTKKNRSDSYVKAYLLPDKTRSGKRKTKVKKHTLNPSFNEVLKYAIDISELETRTMWLSVWHNDLFGHNDFLGEVLVPFDEYTFGHDISPKWHTLEERQPPTQLLQYKGDMVLSVRYVSAENISPHPGKKKPSRKSHGLGQLEVLIREARNLTAMDSNGFSDPFCKGYLLPDKSKSGKQKTDVVKKNCNPQWNHTLVFPGVDLEGLRERSIELTVWDHDAIGSNEFLGGVRLNVGTGRSFGRDVDWMDARGEEISLWQGLLDQPNCWIDGSIMLRPNMDKRQ